jgi:Na+-driven multidrug efflux pump
MAANFVMNQCLRSEGSAAYSMIGIVSGAILNIALDPLFIFVFGWGIKGAAAATAISKFVSFAILITPYLRHSSLLRLSLRNVKYARDIVVEVTKMGSPTLIRIGLVATSTIILNNLAGQFSESALAGISVSNRVMMLMNSVVLGFGQGYQPVAGFNWGAKRFDRVRSAFIFSSISGVIAATALGIVLAVFTRQVMLLFTTVDEEMLAIGLLCIRLQCLTLPIHAWVIVVNMSYASLGKAKGAAILSLSRQGICFIPMIILLPRLFGVNGLAAAQAAADVLSLLIALPLCVSLLREIRLLMNEQNKSKKQPLTEQPAAVKPIP